MANGHRGSKQDELGFHVYSACAVCVGAVLQNQYRAASFAPCSLPIIGGESFSVVGAKSWPEGSPVLSFASAETKVTGKDNDLGTEFTTEVSIHVRGLNILGRIKGNIHVTLKFVYTKVDDQRDNDFVVTTIRSHLGPENEPFSDILIDDEKPPFTLNAAMYGPAGQNFKQFKQDINSKRPNDQHIKHPHGRGKGDRHELVFTALAEPAAKLMYDAPNFGLHDYGDGLQVYFGEWHAEPYRQNLTLLRARFSNTTHKDTGNKFTGDIVIDEEVNGRG